MIINISGHFAVVNSQGLEILNIDSRGIPLKADPFFLLIKNTNNTTNQKVKKVRNKQGNKFKIQKFQKLPKVKKRQQKQKESAA